MVFDSHPVQTLTNRVCRWLVSCDLPRGWAIFLGEEDRRLFLGVLSEVVPDFNWAVHSSVIPESPGS